MSPQGGAVVVNSPPEGTFPILHTQSHLVFSGQSCHFR